MSKRLLTAFFLTITSINILAQEVLMPVNYNPHVNKTLPKNFLKTTALSLPFFEDFASESPFPDNSKWTDRAVYINNTMAIDPVSRGVATFDALDYRGAPYDSTNPYALIYADSLTSQPIDISTFTPADSLYLSFFYQPKGRGFAPESHDSLMLYLKTSSNVWIKAWAMEGSLSHPFRQVMIAVADTSFFHNNFQFRFVNKASIDQNDDIWNVDYIRFAANRSIYDTAVRDITTTLPPTNILNDYTSMPYRQFVADKGKELAPQHSFYGKNGFNTQRSVVYGYTARESISNTMLFSSAVSNDNPGGYTTKQYSFPVYNISYSAPSPYSRVVFENKYFISDPTGTDPKTNDTIIHQQIFDNYLAYDDGTAEMSYFLKQGVTLPAKSAIEFHLNQADTLRGVAIYFGRQVPLAFSKFFSIAVYKNITVGAYFDTALYQQDLYFPGYVDTVNHFWVYKFDDPVPLQAGTFFLGTIQPAQSGSDSLYFGIDLNRAGGNHLYVNVDGTWKSSQVQGALMIRPLLGQTIIGTDVSAAKNKSADWKIYPNPAGDFFIINTTETAGNIFYEITDVQGRVIRKASTDISRRIDVSTLNAGIYFVRILANGQRSLPKKIIKL